MNYRSLTSFEIEHLQNNGCSADDWSTIDVSDEFNPTYVCQVHFSGKIRLGRFEKVVTLPGGVSVHTGIYHARLHNTTVEDNVYIREIHNYIANYHIGEDAYIEHTNALFVDQETTFGNGIRVPVMNEGGGREVPIFDGLSAHLAYILTTYRQHHDAIQSIQKRIDAYANAQKSTIGTIGKCVRIVNCGVIKNVRIGDYALLDGVAKLANGTINSNQDAPVQIGSGVECDDFIIASGAHISSSTLVSRCFVGQGCLLDKHYSALDSLFFANCQGMHGEATAIFAGPYTVSHHKSTLLIAGMFSFFNAGSGSNQSNHLYKLGPLHQGVVERGSKTTSDSYLLWPARIGAFTLVMGRHTKHSDTSDLPFSYLIENATESYLVPAANLRSVGTIRDAQKWAKRDARTDRHKIDQINFQLLNPYTVQKMMNGVAILENLEKQSDKDCPHYAYNNCVIRRSSLCNGIALYKMAIAKFLGNALINRLAGRKFTSIAQIRERLLPTTKTGVGTWSDLAGLLVPQHEISVLMNELAADKLSLEAIQKRFEYLHTHYDESVWSWSYDNLLTYWGKQISDVTTDDLVHLVEQWQQAVVSLDEMLYSDAQKEFGQMAHVGFGIDGDELQKTQDFEAVRGTFETNTFVCEVVKHMAEKKQLADAVIAQLNAVN